MWTLVLKVLWCRDGGTVCVCIIKDKHELHNAMPVCTQSCPTSLDKLGIMMAIRHELTAWERSVQATTNHI